MIEYKGKEETRKKKQAEEIDVYSNFTGQVAEIHYKLKFTRLLVDSTDVGSPILFLCSDLELPADGLKLTQDSRKEILSNLRILIEQKRAEFPNDRDLAEIISRSFLL